MDRTTKESQGYRLESQIRELYGMVTYRQLCHDRYVTKTLKLYDTVKTWQIILSAITASGCIVATISDDKIGSIIGAFVSFGMLIFSTYTKNFNLVASANKHKMASDALWNIRQEYLSLLVDFDRLKLDEIVTKRDELQDRTAQIHASAPSTDAKSNKSAKMSIVNEKEQAFTEEEIDALLPESIRRKKKI